MRTDSSRGTFQDVITNHSPTVKQIARTLRKTIQAIDQNACEVPRPDENHVAYGIGLDKANEIYGYICPLEDYVRLGFYYGGGLPDPDKLLVGSGKRLRHIKLYSLAEAERPAVRALIEQAVTERKKALGTRKGV
jgi:hypothetical protein